MRKPNKNKSILTRELADLRYRLTFVSNLHVKLFRLLMNHSDNGELFNSRAYDNLDSKLKKEIILIESQIKKNIELLNKRKNFRNKKRLQYTIKDMINNKSTEKIANCRFFSGQGSEILINIEMFKRSPELTRIIPETFIDIFKAKLQKYEMSSAFARKAGADGLWSYKSYVNNDIYGILTSNKSENIEKANKFLADIKDTIFCRILNTNKHYSLKLSEIYVILNSKRKHKSAERLINSLVKTQYEKITWKNINNNLRYVIADKRFGKIQSIDFARHLTKVANNSLIKD